MSPYASSHVRTSYWDGPSRWINTALLVIAGFIGLDTLLRLLGANPENGVVSFVRAVAGVFLAPFRNMFPEQQYLLTALIALLGWSLLAGLILAVVRNVGPDREVVHREQRVDEPVHPEAQPPREHVADPDPTRRL
ncbi:MAG TPA: hypothetical protein VNU01_08100 [Egibacteraceae bacterium]|nr:hypothetical protein [Egibacteraceae bacterium]